MKNKKTSIAGFIFALIYVLTIAGLLFSLNQEITAGNETAQDRFAILTRETSQNLNTNEVGSEAFTDRFLESLGDLSDIAGVQLKYNNSLIFSYPADIANGVITNSRHAKLSSTNINSKDNGTLTLSAAIYKLKPAVFRRNLKIAFVVILATTLICITCLIYTSLYDKDTEEEKEASENKNENKEIESVKESEDLAQIEEPEEKDDIAESQQLVETEETVVDSYSSSNTAKEEFDDDDDDFLFDDDDDLPLDEEDDIPLEEDNQNKETVQNNTEKQELAEEPVNEEVVEEEDFIEEEPVEETEDFVEEEEEKSEQEDFSYSKIQISPAEYSALQEAIDKTQAEFEAESIEDESEDIFKAFEEENEVESNEEQPLEEQKEEVQKSEENNEEAHLTSMHPKGLFSEKTGFGWEAYMITRLDSELLRAASSEQDLSLFTIRIQDLTWFTDEGKEIADLIKSIVNFPDLIFEYETDGCTAILPNTHIDQSLKTADDLYTGITEILQQYGNSNRIGIGISAKSLRMISGERLANESQEALRHAFQDENSPIVAFKVNPQKYRNFLAAQAEDETES